MKKTHARYLVAMLALISVAVLGYVAWCSSPFFIGRTVQISKAVSPAEEAQVIATLKSEGWLNPLRFDSSLSIHFLNPANAYRYRTVEVHVEENGIYSVSGFEGSHGGFSFAPDARP